MGHKILVVDDITVNRAIMKATLENIEDVEFIDAVNGVEALKCVEEQEISLVILDLMMPIKDGFEVLKEMKQSSSLSDIPVIVYSANEDVESVTVALELGAYDYFTKPLKPREMKVILPMKVKNALKSYEQQKTIQALNLKMQVDLLMANVFQQSLLREKIKMSHAVMYGKYVPNQEIGGEFYDCIEIEDKIWFIMADVAGDGVSAAMLSSMLKVEFQNCIKNFNSPEKVLKVMNNTFYKMTQGSYPLTAFIGLIHNGTLCYANAGQPYPLVFNSQSQTVNILRDEGENLGLVKNQTFILHKIDIVPGDIVITYTQGLIEDKLIVDGVEVYDDLAGCFMNYRYLIEKDISVFFTAVFRLFGNIATTDATNEVAMMLVCVE